MKNSNRSYSLASERKARENAGKKMKKWAKIELVLPQQDVETFCNQIRMNWHLEPVSIHRPGEKISVISIYVESIECAQKYQRQLVGQFPSSSVHVITLQDRDWTTFWRRHFRIQDIGSHLRIVPVWERAPDRKRLNLWIDPGLSFGTGDHFTTRFCLEQIERAAEIIHPSSFLDVGTGSGILAIAAAKLGIRLVAAADNDPQSLRQAKKNIKRNRLPTNRIQLFTADISQPGLVLKPADVVCANILSNILIQGAPTLWRATRRWLILSGIRESEADGVVEAYLNAGAREILRDGDGNWCGIVLERIWAGEN